MGVVIEIPSALKQYVNDQDEVEVSGSSVEEVFEALVSEYAEVKATCLMKTVKFAILSMFT